MVPSGKDVIVIEVIELLEQLRERVLGELDIHDTGIELAGDDVADNGVFEIIMLEQLTDHEAHDLEPGLAMLPHMV